MNWVACICRGTNYFSIIPQLSKNWSGKAENESFLSLDGTKGSVYESSEVSLRTCHTQVGQVGKCDVQMGRCGSITTVLLQTLEGAEVSIAEGMYGKGRR